MNIKTKRNLRIFYAAGPGDIIQSYQDWYSGCDTQLEQAITYSSQFFDLCREIQAKSYVTSSRSERRLFRGQDITIRHSPPPFRDASGAMYHVRQILEGLRLIGRALIFRADVVIVSTGTTHWFLLSLLRVGGIRVIASLHTTLWLRGKPLSRVKRLILWLDSVLLFRNRVDGILVLSDEVASQLRELTGRDDLPVQMFLPNYRRADFESIPPPGPLSEFRVLYIGRIEREKGVFDLLEVAARLRDIGRDDIKFDICGDGSDLNALRRKVIEEGLENTFNCHGHCGKMQLRPILSRSHAVIVPTTSSFGEGLNKVVVEGALARRPVIASSACPALDYIRTGIIVVEADSISNYVEAIIRLASDETTYRKLAGGDAREREQFYDISRGWGSALKALLGR